MIRNTQTITALLVFYAVSMSGCTLLNTPTKSDPAVMTGGKTLPTHWTGGRFTVPGPAVTDWINDFQSATLKSLTREAVSNNYSLKSARMRVNQALERGHQINMDRRISVDASVSATRSQSLRGAGFQTVQSSNFNRGLDFSWEVDIWGRVKDLRDAQLDQAVAETNLYEWSRLSIAASVAKTSLEVVESRLQINLSKKNLKSLETNLAILDSKLEAGDADDRTALEISLSRSDVARAKSGILVEERQIDTARRRLEALLGRYPKGQVDGLKSLPKISRKVPAGLPSQLLLRRPDILAAEAEVDSQLKTLSASRKALLPAIRLTAGVGTSTTSEFDQLFNINNLVWNIGANLSRPVYDSGRLQSNIRLDAMRLEALTADYADSTLVAFREVETALSSEGYLRKQISTLETAVVEARRAEELSLSQYEKGLVDIITLLQSQRRYFDSQSNLLNAQLQLLLNRVDLYLALGGDFDTKAISK